MRKLFMLIILLVLSACNGQGTPTELGAGVGSLRPLPAEPVPVEPPQKPEVPVPPPLATGCLAGDTGHICIGLKAVAYQDAKGNSVINEAAARSAIERVNAIWNTCDIGFQIEEFKVLDPTTYGLSYGAQSQSETTAIRQTFSNSTTFLVGFTGSWNTNTIAWTAMPGGGPFGAIIDADFAANEVAVGHELGHYMGLDHVNDVNDLMNPVVYITARNLTAAQCATARATNQSDWPEMLRK